MLCPYGQGEGTNDEERLQIVPVVHIIVLQTKARAISQYKRTVSLKKTKRTRAAIETLATDPVEFSSVIFGLGMTFVRANLQYFLQNRKLFKLQFTSIGGTQGSGKQTLKTKKRIYITAVRAVKLSGLVVLFVVISF